MIEETLTSLQGPTHSIAAEAFHGLAGHGLCLSYGGRFEFFAPLSYLQIKTSLITYIEQRSNVKPIKQKIDAVLLG